jgi:23S rRNA (cytosine1962-C5)-methyltransferase
MMRLILKKGREKSLLRRHPWVFSGAVQSVDSEASSGDTVSIQDADGQFLAWGAYSPESQIRARVWSWDEGETVDIDFFRRKLFAAKQLRQSWLDLSATTAYRLVHAESDGIPGLVVDQYNDVLVVQFLSAGVESWRESIVGVMKEIFDPVCIYERSDVAVRELEGLPLRTGILHGQLPDASHLSILENGLRFNVDLVGGQKTGFYLDQRDNRRFCQELSRGRSVLNGFSFTGGFTVNALDGGATSVLSIDSSEDVLELAKENVQINGLPADKCAWIVGDMFAELRTLRDRGQQFDLVILDPPKFAPTAAQAKQAARGYKDINLFGFKLLKPGGILMTFSCSGGVDMAFFQKIVADAALDAGVDARLIQRLGQAPDHPTRLSFPEGTYLKGLVCQI